VCSWEGSTKVDGKEMGCRGVAGIRVVVGANVDWIQLTHLESVAGLKAL
jgi:hypothetical protein